MPWNIAQRGQRRRRPSRLWAGVLFCAAWGALLCGCQPPAPRQEHPSDPLNPPVRSWEPIGIQIQRVEPLLKGQPFRVLLDFETHNDLAFIAGAPSLHRDLRAAHTGLGSLCLPTGNDSFAVRLDTLLGEQPFPGNWSLAGAYFYSSDAAKVTVSYYRPVVGAGAGLPGPAAQRTVTLLPGQWNPVMVDLSPLADPNAGAIQSAGSLCFTVAGTRSPVWCDDVILQNNTRYLTELAVTGTGWTVRQHGLVTTIDNPGLFKIDVPTPGNGPDGWQVCEASAMRVVCRSFGGEHWWTIYSDGRQYRDGKFEPLVSQAAADGAAARQHLWPAQAVVAEGMGRVDRNNPADPNNDGYAEMTGSYELLAANQPRFEVTLTPQTPVLVRPVLDVSRLPPGKVLVSVEGELIEGVVRLPDGRVLVEVPGVIERAVTVNFRVE